MRRALRRRMRMSAEGKERMTGGFSAKSITRQASLILVSYPRVIRQIFDSML